MAATKHCQYCQSEIDIWATRCPHCTSQLQTPVTVTPGSILLAAVIFILYLIFK